MKHLISVTIFGTLHCLGNAALLEEGFEDVLVKTDAFLVKHGYLCGDNTVAEWTADATKGLLEINKKGKQ